MSSPGSAAPTTQRITKGYSSTCPTGDAHDREDGGRGSPKRQCGRQSACVYSWPELVATRSAWREMIPARSTPEAAVGSTPDPYGVLPGDASNASRL